MLKYGTVEWLRLVILAGCYIIIVGVNDSDSIGGRRQAEVGCADLDGCFVLSIGRFMTNFMDAISLSISLVVDNNFAL